MNNSTQIKRYKGITVQKIYDFLRSKNVDVTFKEVDELLKYMSEINDSCSKMSQLELSKLIEVSEGWAETKLGLLIEDPLDKKLQFKNI